jgi:hypothetical protein
VDADDDVRAPPREEFADVADRAAVEELARLGADAVDEPVEVLHPVLPVPQHPVVALHHLRRQVVRLLDGAHHADGVGVSLEELLHPGDDGRRRRAVTAARVGRDDEDFRFP